MMIYFKDLSIQPKQHHALFCQLSTLFKIKKKISSQHELGFAKRFNFGDFKYKL